MALQFCALVLLLLCGKSAFEAHENNFVTDKYVVQNVSINLDHPVFSVDEKFLSVAIDTSIMRQHWKPMNFSSVRFFTLAKALSPAYLRVSGTAADFMTYKKGKSAENVHKANSNFTITHEDLDKIHVMSSKAGWDVMFGLNVLPREKDGSWNASDAKEIMQYVADNGYHFGWELGNEPDKLGCWFHRSISAEKVADAFKTLRTILDRSPQYGNFLVGPDVTKVESNSTAAAKYLESFVSHAKDAKIDAVTWHTYNVNGSNCTEKDFYNPEILDFMLHELKAVDSILSKLAPDSPRWLGETGSAFGGGAPGLSDRYLNGFVWLDKLGLSARLRHDVLIRQSFIVGSCSLVDYQDMEPHADYWISLLHKRLVGKKVLDVAGGLEEMRKVRIYAHCSSRQYYPKGSVTILALNTLLQDPVHLKFDGDLEGKDVDEYLLTPDAGSDLLAKGVRLNGKVLQLVDDLTLPDLVQRSVPGSEPVIMPPLTFGLYVIPKAGAKACL